MFCMSPGSDGEENRINPGFWDVCMSTSRRKARTSERCILQSLTELERTLGWLGQPEKDEERAVEGMSLGHG